MFFQLHHRRLSRPKMVIPRLSDVVGLTFSSLGEGCAMLLRDDML
jgi:hypothetical protein